MSDIIHNMIGKNAEPSENSPYAVIDNITVIGKTFENGNYHICYGIDENGNIYDICILTDTTTFFEAGQCKVETVLEAQEIIKEILESLAVDHTAVQE